jgi:hypothetical protein
MPPKRGRKEPMTDKIFTSKPPPKQRKFPPRFLAVKPALKDEDIERPRKRRKSQTTMTQLDFGKRSFLEAICDSDEESALGSDEDITPKLTRTNRRQKLSANTESQDTLTQFVKRASNVGTMTIGDSEDEAPLSEVEPSDDEKMETGQQIPHLRNAAPQEGEDIPQLSDEEPQIEAKSGPQKEAQPIILTSRQELSLGESLGPPKTPRRVRVLPVPSSRSPPDTPLSTQVTLRTQDISELSSPIQKICFTVQRETEQSQHLPPLAEKSTNVQQIQEDRSPLKEKSTNIQRLPNLRSRRTPGTLPTEKAARTVEAAAAANGESPTKRRVREFNARFAILERENSESRSRRSRSLVTRPSMGNSSTSVSFKVMDRENGVQNMDTQYPMPGIETQEGLMGLKLANTMTEAAINASREGSREASLEVVLSSQHQDTEDVEADVTFEQPLAKVERASGAVIDDEKDTRRDISERSVVEEILIPSSQTRSNRRPAKTTSAFQVAEMERSEPEDQLPQHEESLLESTYNSPAKYSIPKKDTQDLASDQLLRETQQAFQSQVPLSPIVTFMPLSSVSAGAMCPPLATQTRYSLPHPSQATTVDESMPPRSTFHTQQHGLFTPQPHSKALPDEIMSSSLVEEPMELDDQIEVQAISSPLMYPPGLTDVSSSPKLPEPKTPSILRNLKQPLRLGDLVSDSLDHSFPAPPTWRYGDEDDEDEEDDEL